MRINRWWHVARVVAVMDNGVDRERLGIHGRCVCRRVPRRSWLGVDAGQLAGMAYAKAASVGPAEIGPGGLGRKVNVTRLVVVKGSLE